ncbi:putative c4-dicarboxylate transporter malic acid transport protein [Botrytis fragariae]|uniref:Sulfite efflux pump SSU1 n=1 Tax=Botrytis fragariae TaxID=1964551 RepID=A0A8H6EL27_9HELO|nr:putative c4-dicarboxylate transporter malic acid transport protein [Botrytis fragariae]KAF5876149.1 putative c4-dicarboxylate transporter malic acid transport protein [Botrytis fragariae]
MDPSGAGTCAQIARQDANRKTDDGNTIPSSYGSGGAKTFDPVDIEIAKQNTGWRKIVRNFTPSWFSVTMGTGIVSILLHNLPYNGAWLNYVSIIIFVLNIVLFCTFLGISLVRYILYPQIWSAMIRHPAQSLFLGTFPMGLATIINMIVFVCVPAWGGWVVYLAWALWWIDAVISVATCFYLPFVIMSLHKVELSTMTAAWLLPIVAPIVAAASGALLLLSVIPNPQHALYTILISYILFGTGFPLAMTILVIYFQRLTVYKIPPREVIVSVFLPLGPLGQGGFALMQLGKVSLTVFPQTNTLPAIPAPGPGPIFYTLGFLFALIMWGFGLLWLFFALASISRSRFPFNMGWWGFTFPLGVFTTSTVMIGAELPSRFFRVLGTIFSVLVTALWVMVAVGTVKRAFWGGLIFAPCLKDVEGRRGRRGYISRAGGKGGRREIRRVGMRMGMGLYRGEREFQVLFRVSEQMNLVFREPYNKVQL